MDKAAELKAEYDKASESDNVENEDVGSQSFLNLLIYGLCFYGIRSLELLVSFVLIQDEEVPAEKEVAEQELQDVSDEE